MRMHDMILPRLRAGKDPIPSSYLRQQKQARPSAGMDSDGPYDMDSWDIKDYLRDGGGDVAVIPISGTMSREGMCGMGNEYVARILGKADAMKQVKAVVLKINTPGGTVDSTEMLADAIKNFSKPIVAWTPFCGSAGYFVASQCDAIVMENSVTSEVGSIGVLMVYTDISERLKKEGMAVTIFRATGSEDKTLVNGIEPLTDELKAEIQGKLNECRKVFLGYVRRGRVGKLQSDEVFSGKMYGKKEAVRLGLADGVGSLSEAVKRARKM